jgi:hypothetical protein
MAIRYSHFDHALELEAGPQLYMMDSCNKNIASIVHASTKSYNGNIEWLSGEEDNIGF